MTSQKVVQVDLKIEDDGTVTFTLTPTDATGAPESLPVGTPPVTATSSSPALTLAISSADTSGFGLIWTGTPTALATGVVATFTTTLVGATVPITAAAAPIDIVGSAVTGFSVVETANA